MNRNLGWRWTQWVMAFITFGTSALIFVLFPETQYTNSTVVNRHRRSLLDNFRFWRVSGGGKAKVHSFAVAFAFPFRYLVHPVVILCTSFFSLYLVATNYLLVSFPQPSAIFCNTLSTIIRAWLTNPFFSQTKTTASLSYLEVYHFTIDEGGLTNIAPLLGIWCAMFYCGVLSDRQVMAKLNRDGQHKKPPPEKRLPLLVFSGILGVVGTALFGGSTQHKLHWMGAEAGSFGSTYHWNPHAP